MNSLFQSIPDGWQRTTLRHLAQGPKNGAWASEAGEDEIDAICVRVADFDWSRLTLKLDDPTTRSFKKQQFKNLQLRGGDIVIEKSGGGEKTPVGRVVSFDENVEAVTSNFVARIRPHKDVWNRFFLYLLAALYVSGYSHQFIKQNTGIQNLDDTNLFRSEVWVPDLATQRQIAEFLDRETARIDLLIEKKQRLVALLGEREEGTFIEHVTGKDLPYEKKHSGVEWIKEIPKHWFAPKFTQIARQETGHTPSRKVEGYWVPQDCVIPWVSLADVWQIRGGQAIYISETSEKISELGMANSSARLLPKDTVILSRTASVGFPAIMSEPMATTQDFAAWICGKQMRPLFLYYVLRSMKPVFRRLMMGSTHQTIYMPDIRSFRTPLPPLVEQDAIVSRLASTIQVFRQSSETLTKSIDRLKEYRSALITAAVTGQIDVQTYAKSGTPDRRLEAIQEEMGA